MSFRIKTHGRIGASLKRVADEEIAAAGKELQSLESEGMADAVHEARKHFKKMRALVQLLRAPLGAKAVRAEQKFYRALGRELQRVRDAQAQTITLQGLVERFFDTRRPPLVAAAGRLLADEEERACRAIIKNDVASNVIASLGNARLRVDAWKLDDFRWKDLRAALRRSYRRARDAWRHASAETEPRALHDWRRRTKDLFYHATLCHGIAPDSMDELVGELDVLSEFLGNDHDLVVLRTLLERHPGEIPPGHARNAFFKIIALRRKELLDAAFDLAGRVFVESPREFIDALDERREDHRLRRKKAKRMAEELVAVR